MQRFTKELNKLPRGDERLPAYLECAIIENERGTRVCKFDVIGHGIDLHRKAMRKYIVTLALQDPDRGVEEEVPFRVGAKSKIDALKMARQIAEYHKYVPCAGKERATFRTIDLIV